MNKLFSFFAVLCLGFSLNANAISIDLVTDNSAINFGDNVEVQVRINGLEGATALSVYDLNLNYDASLFSFSNLIWGDSSKGNQLDLIGHGSMQDSSSGSGWLNLFELSLDEIADLELLQENEFTLFSVVFTSIALGSGNFFITNNIMGDAYGNELSVDTFTDAQVAVDGGVSVPEPSSLLLLLGLLAIVVLRNKIPSSSK